MTGTTKRENGALNPTRWRQLKAERDDLPATPSLFDEFDDGTQQPRRSSPPRVENQQQRVRERERTA